MEKQQQGRLESTAVGLGASALAFIVETNQQADLEWFITERTGEVIRYEEPGGNWEKTLECAVQACAHISRMFTLVADRRKR